jgi:hypothetical protein
MSPIPGKPLDTKQPDMQTADGRKVTLKLPGFTPPPPEPKAPPERAAAEPPADEG